MHDKPRPYRYLSEMPDKGRVALERCHTTYVYVGKHSEHSIATRTINVLLDRELIGEGRDKKSKKIWRPSTLGLDLIMREEPQLLAARLHKGYTTKTSEAARDEPEGVGVFYLRHLTADANDRLQGLPGRRQEALRTEAVNLTRRLKQEIRSCDPSCMAVAAQLERIRIEIARLEDLRAA